ncbi:hypothetical protein COY95_00075 [Candidatus Woesearchaeota archaeon CG_4_10_14_0_8_um_filter_47_5]|nr:MAG: hypothetical protein COY95_00075 [Candidatus Woesearchaeota archaeon CG_4_10_14_0_8_um_filter_47_5]
MKDMIKKGILLGLGIGALTREKAEAFVKDIQKDGTLTPEEGKKYVRELLKESEKAHKHVEALVRKHIDEALAKSPFVTKKDLREFMKETKPRKAAKKGVRKKKR